MFENTQTELKNLDKNLGAVLYSLTDKYVVFFMILMVVSAIILILISYRDYKKREKC
jgi:hypothetical protein